MKDISKPQDASLEQSLPEVLMRLVSELHDVAYLIERVEPQLLELGDANLMQHPDSIKVLQGIDLAVQKTLGVPYTDEMIAGAARDAIGQATPDSDGAFEMVERYGEDTQISAFDRVTTSVTELDALIA